MMKASTTRFRTTSSFGAGVLIGLAVVVTGFAMLGTETTYSQIIALGLSVTLALGAALKLGRAPASLRLPAELEPAS
jgi:hypothetical protein